MTVIATSQVWVDNGVWGDTTWPSCFGLPGQNLPPAYCKCEFGIRAEVHDNLDVYLAINGYIGQERIVGSPFPCYMAASPFPFTAEREEIQRQPSLIFEEVTKDPAIGNFNWTINGNWQEPVPDITIWNYVGKLDDFGWSDENPDNGIVHIAGIAVYEVTTEVFPPSVPIELPGLRRYHDYYPWAVYGSSDLWWSCNRPGGSLKRWDGGQWADMKNNDAPDGAYTMSHYNGSFWEKAPKIGNGG